jgi:membrane protein YqaA with SNARE-associated domain
MNEIVPPPPAVKTPPPTRNPLKRLYHWILSWANHPYGTWILAILAFLDSAVFPIPPLFLQVALSIERPKRSWWYAFVDTTASVAGACLGYAIGYWLWDAVGHRIIGDLTPELRHKIESNQFGVTFVYSFIPLPYKLITIGSGFLHVSLATLLIASTLGRSLRFFGLGAICYFMGARAKEFIEKYFNWVMVGIGLIVVAVLVILKFILKR